MTGLKGKFAELCEKAVESSYTKKSVNISSIIPFVDSSWKGEEEDIYPFICTFAEKLGFDEESIFPRTGETLFRCFRCKEFSRAQNSLSCVTLFHMNGNNLLEEFSKGLHGELEKRCSTCKMNTSHETHLEIHHSKYLMLRPSNLVHSIQVDQMKYIQNIGLLSLVGFATREGDDEGNSGHWWFTRMNKDSTSLKLDGVQEQHQDVMTTLTAVSQGNLFVFKRLKRTPLPLPSSNLSTPSSQNPQKSASSSFSPISISVSSNSPIASPFSSPSPSPSPSKKRIAPASFPIASSSSSTSTISNSSCPNSPKSSTSSSPTSSNISPPSPSPPILVDEGEKSEVDISEEEIIPPPKKRGEKILQTSCTICDKLFSKASNVRRHMITIHFMDVNQVKKIQIPNTVKQCSWCGVMQKNLTTHKRHCKKFLEFESIKKMKSAETENEPTLSLLPPKKKVKGPVEFIKLFTNYMKSNGPKTSKVKKRYINKVQDILMYWEAKIVGFFSSNLLHPLQTQAVLPNVSDFLKTVKSEFIRFEAAKAYKHLCLFVLSHFQQTSSSLSDYSFQEKTAFEHHVQSRMLSNSSCMRDHNKVAGLKTIINKEEQRSSGQDLRHNSNRTWEIFQHIANLRSVSDAVVSITDNPESWSEEAARKLLVCILIIFSGGIRPSVALRMTIKEFKNSVQTEDGTMVAQVFGSKTIMSWGLAPLPFFYNGVYGAISSYISYFKSFAEDHHAVFSAQCSGEPQEDAGTHFTWFKSEYLGGYFSNKTESDTFVPKIWRHGWANWKHQNPSKTIRNLGQQAMGQSTATVIKNYADSIPENVIKFGRAILSNIVKLPGNTVKFPDESDTEHKAASKKRRREDSEESSISDSASPSVGKKTKTLASEVSKGTNFFSKRCFLPKDRDYLRTLFFKDNEPPTSLQEVKILFFEKNDARFKKIWTQTLERKAEEARCKGATDEEAEIKAKIAAKSALRKTLQIGRKKKKKKEYSSEEDHYDYPAGRPKSF